jgi:hypothetical protein
VKLKGLALAVAALCGLGVGCGNDDDGGDATAAQAAPAITLTTTEQGGRVQLDLSGSPRPGLNVVRYRNDAKAEHEAQLLRVRGERSEREVVAGLRAASAGKFIPSWLRAAGGASPLGPGELSRAEVVLRPGTYYAVDLEEDSFEAGGIVKFEVPEGAGTPGGLPAAKGTVTAYDYGFRAKGLQSGKNLVRFDNEGREIHHVIAVPMLPGKTLAEVRRFMRTEKGPPPIKFDQMVGTSAIDSGGSENAELQLKPGKYALLCFVSDRDGGPPHVAQGMIGEAVVR